MLSVRDITASRGHRVLFRHLSFELSAGQTLHLTGANGVGKTTLLRIISGLARAQAGVCLLQARSQAQWEDAFGSQFHYIGHQNALKDTLSPLENLSLTASLASECADEKSLLTALNEAGIVKLADVPVRQLSQGQQRRAALARLLALPRPLWLLDEPFVALDTSGQALLGEWISRHAAEGGAVLFTSHQQLPPTLCPSQTITLEAP
ncbi:cytochrome c biogenesis heme-transporting ATPase CcmA [Chitinibacteraceae bacterium HSL-7]